MSPLEFFAESNVARIFAAQAKRAPAEARA
jgi:hypothetical protein